MFALRKLSSSISDLLNLQNKHLSLHDNYEEKNYPLHFAAKMGNSILLEKLLKSNYFKVDMEDQKGRTALHYAVQNACADVTIILLNYWANVDANDYMETSPAHLAVQVDQINQVLLLIKHGAEFFAKDKYGKTPFNIACEYGYIKIIEILISSCILTKILQEIENSPNSNISPLHLAARHGHVEICALLINHGFPLNHANSHGSALHEAVKNGRIPVVRLLLNLGINHKIVDSFGCTAGELAEKGVDRNPISAREIIVLMKDYPRRVYGTAIRNYSADESTGHLSLSIGDIVWITDQTSCEKKGLWKGIVFTAKGTSRSGYFPAPVVEVDKEEFIDTISGQYMSNKLRSGTDLRCPSAPSSSSSSILKTPKTPRKLKMVPMPTVPDFSKLPTSLSKMNMNSQHNTDSESNASSTGDKHSSAATLYYLPRRPSALNLPPNCSTSPTPSRTDSCLEGSASFTDEDFPQQEILTMTSTTTTFPTTSLITRHSFSKKSDRNSTSSGCSQASSGFESAKTASQLASSNSSSSCGSSNLVNHNSSMSSGVSSLTDSPSNRSTGGMSTGTASSSSSPYYYCNGDGAYDIYGHVGNGQAKKFNVRELMAKGVA
uniref:SH3 domain-containing protein n=1 Tax=Acrobeloides nanus TaxID=290746 RepID=A0A914E8N8_9BILA